ncbi:MAG TPA: hypothetical protein VKD70_09980 [Candidatus Acidoferrum sp.]|nr:hypothetical protein [Candidatus Acidoferrum sp.]
MASHSAYVQQFQRITLAVPAFVGLAMATGRADEAASPACLLVSAAQEYALRALVDLIPAVLQATEGCGFNWSSFSLLQVLVTGWHILGGMLGA